MWICKGERMSLFILDKWYNLCWVIFFDKKDIIIIIISISSDENHKLPAKSTLFFLSLCQAWFTEPAIWEINTALKTHKHTHTTSMLHMNITGRSELFALFCCAEIETRGTSGSLTGANLVSVMARNGNTTLLGNCVPTDDPSDRDSTSLHACTGRTALTTGT